MTKHPGPHDWQQTQAAGPNCDSAHCRVVKTLRPLQPGTLKLMQRFGSSLVCVRHREDAKQQTRYTTVEIVIDSAPRKKRQRDGQWVELRIEWRESTLRARAKALGARLDPQTALWRMPHRAARILGLIDRIAPTDHP